MPSFLKECNVNWYINNGHNKTSALNIITLFSWEIYWLINPKLLPISKADKKPPDVITENNLLACLFVKHSLNTSQKIIATTAIWKSTKI